MEHLDAAEIFRFFRGQLPPERAVEVQRHLVECPQCAAKLEGESQAPTETASVAVGNGPFAPIHPLTPAPAPKPSLNTGERSDPAREEAGSTLERGQTVGRYLILERVGEGGMGVVYSAWDPDLSRRVAIKLLHSGKPSTEGRSRGQARLLREAQAMARVSHANVISVFDVGTFGDSVFVAMEFVDGTTLRKWVKEQKRPWREVLDTFMAAGRGLAGAHGAGLVHRDFKPDNVLVGKDGRVRVTDFGLARLADEEADSAPPLLPEGAAVEEGVTLAQVTQEGQVVGTPMFMAPEQRRGEAPEARSDQFSFCVALYWALYGDWPFDRKRSTAGSRDPASSKGTDRQSQRTQTPRPIDPVTGAFEPPRDSKVPAFIRQALMRGLAPEPKERFDSMEALLGQLEYRPRTVRRMAAAAAVVLLAGAGSAAWYTQESARREALLCTGAEQKLAGIWDEAARTQVTQALLATQKPDAADVASRVTRMLDGYARNWVETSTEACRATRVRGEQTEALLSLRVVCLERRLKDVKAVTGVLATADAELLGKAADTVAQLPSLASCADVVALSQVTPPPDTPQARAEIDRISSLLAEAKALNDAGRYKKGLEAAAPAVQAASTLGYQPLHAEALFWRGWLEARSGSRDVGAQHLTETLWAALAARNDEVLARAATKLVFAAAAWQGKPDVALQWSDLGKAALVRMGGNEDIESELFNNLGVMYAQQGRNAEALASLQRALQLAERALGPEHSRRANILGNLGNLYNLEGQHPEAAKVLADGLALRERLSGPDHPLTGAVHEALAKTQLFLRDYPKAQTHARRSLDIQSASLGPEHPQLASIWHVVGQSYKEAGQCQEALSPYQKALAILEKTLGKNHVDVSSTLNDVAQCYLELGEPAQAVSHFERVLALNPAEPSVRADAAFGLARALEPHSRKRPQALASAQKARAAYEEAKQPERVKQVDEWLAKHESPKKKKGSRKAQGR
jgi:tetratricopeptide (TPR) repeat protein